MIHWTKASSGHYVGGGYDLMRVGPPGDPRKWRLEGHGHTAYFSSPLDARRSVDRAGVREGRRRRRKRKAKPNPKTSTVLILGGGLALLAVGYFFLRPKTASANLPTASSAPQLTAGGQAIVYTGSDGTQYTRDHACQVARQLIAIGHPAEAVFWSNLCTSNGGTV